MLTVVLQGGITSWTLDFARQYKKLPFVSEVIISTWKDDNIGDFSDFIVVQSKKHENHGCGNRNLQIQSSFNGLKLSQTEWSLKVRSDMFLPHLEEMFSFAKENINDDIEAFVASVYKPFPFHPRDHFFLGKTKSLIDIFDIPYCNLWSWQNDYRHVSRAESYIGHYSYFKKSKEDRELYQLIRSYPNAFLPDNSPRKKEALEVYHKEIKNRRVFVPFPRFEIVWPKHYPWGYPFDRLQQEYGEIYWDDIDNAIP